jgi:hypothetical protein
VEPAQRGRRHHRERVHDGTELAQRPGQVGAVGLVAEVRRLDDREVLAAHELRHLLHVREAHQAAH